MFTGLYDAYVHVLLLEWNACVEILYIVYIVLIMSEINDLFNADVVLFLYMSTLNKVSSYLFL